MGDLGGGILWALGIRDVTLTFSWKLAEIASNEYMR